MTMMTKVLLPFVRMMMMMVMVMTMVMMMVTMKRKMHVMSVTFAGFAECMTGRWALRWQSMLKCYWVPDSSCLEAACV